MLTAVAIVLGFVFDLIVGDPVRFPHPVVAMGRVISWYNKKVRPLFGKVKSSEVFAGAVLAFGLPLLSFGICWAILAPLYLVHPVVGVLGEAFMCWQIFSARELWRQSMAVGKALKEQGLEAGRKMVARIVGRDVDSLDEVGVTKATIETVAENTTDGVISPLIFMAIGGAPLGMFYKAINTMDSMIGYKNDEYLNFGRFAAKLDDVANFIPARFTAFCMMITAPFVGLSAKGAWRIWRRDKRNHASPNSAQTEAACAGALGIQLAGDAVYFGGLVQKPTIGDATRSIEVDDILKANKLMMSAGILALAVCCGIRIACFVLLGQGY